MRAWLAVGLGGVTALGMQALLESMARAARLPDSPLAAYGVLFVALVLAGYVAGHFVHNFHAVYGALAAVLYIFVATTINAVREVSIARQFGLGALAPLDFLQLALTDVVAMTGASCGGWLAGRAS
jgi:hypothetical protein